MAKEQNHDFHAPPQDPDAGQAWTIADAMEVNVFQTGRTTQSQYILLRIPKYGVFAFSKADAHRMVDEITDLLKRMSD